MAEINVKTNNLSIEIANLRMLKYRIATMMVICPQVEGGGIAVQELENVGKAYKKLHKKLGTLVSDTVAFMENVNNSYIDSDNKATHNFE